MKSTFIDFAKLKASVPITAVLDHYGIRLRRVGRHSLRGDCPLPTHSSKTSANTFCVDIALNVWACHSLSCCHVRGNRTGGSVLDLIVSMEGCSIREAGKKLWQCFLSDDGGNLPDVGRDQVQTPTLRQLASNVPLPFTLKYIDPTHHYIRSRGVSEETARTFGIGYFAGSSILSGRIVIPIHDSLGELVAYAGRSCDGSRPKYRFPRGFKKSLELFNLHRAVGASKKALIVVEGFFDCMKVHQAGFPCVVGLMGSSLSEPQSEALSKFEQIVLFLDNDQAGRKASADAAGRLAHRAFIRIVRPSEGKQPDQLTSKQIQEILSTP